MNCLIWLLLSQKKNPIFRLMASYKNVRQLLWLYSHPMTHFTKSYIEIPNGITVEDGARSLNTIELHI